jgi:hypothetical protein
MRLPFLLSRNLGRDWFEKRKAIRLSFAKNAANAVLVNGFFAKQSAGSG